MRWNSGRMERVVIGVGLVAAILVTIVVVSAMATRSISAAAGLRILEVSSVVLVLAAAVTRALRDRASRDGAEGKIAPSAVERNSKSGGRR